MDAYHVLAMKGYNSGMAIVICRDLPSNLYKIHDTHARTGNFQIARIRFWIGPAKQLSWAEPAQLTLLWPGIVCAHSKRIFRDHSKI